MLNKGYNINNSKDSLLGCPFNILKGEKEIMRQKTAILLLGLIIFTTGCAKPENTDDSVITAETETGAEAETVDTLETVEITEGVESIEEYAFYRCENLKLVCIPKTIKTIGKRAFYCSGLKTIVIPKTIKKIDESSFENCDSMERICNHNSRN